MTDLKNVEAENNLNLTSFELRCPICGAPAEMFFKFNENGRGGNWFLRCRNSKNETLYKFVKVKK